MRNVKPIYSVDQLLSLQKNHAPLRNGCTQRETDHIVSVFPQCSVGDPKNPQLPATELILFIIPQYIFPDRIHQPLRLTFGIPVPPAVVTATQIGKQFISDAHPEKYRFAARTLFLRRRDHPLIMLLVTTLALIVINQLLGL